MKQTRGHSIRGLTYGEMLIVLAVFSILAIMFIVSSKFAMIKTRHSVVLQEHKQLNSALETYQLFTMGLPTEDEGLEAISKSANSYLKTNPVDPFNHSYEGPQNYRYYTDLSDENSTWLLVSVGPDGDADVDPAMRHLRSSEPVVGLGDGSAPRHRRTLHLTRKQIREFINRHSYDPTNGSHSNGDIITVGRP